MGSFSIFGCGRGVCVGCTVRFSSRLLYVKMSSGRDVRVEGLRLLVF
jgi:hypothetical protein